MSLWICTCEFSACLLQEFFRCPRSGVKQLCTAYLPARAVGIFKQSTILQHPLSCLMCKPSVFSWYGEKLSRRFVQKHITLNWDMDNAYILGCWKILHTFNQIIWNTISLFPNCKIFFWIWPGYPKAMCTIWDIWDTLLV